MRESFIEQLSDIVLEDGQIIFLEPKSGESLSLPQFGELQSRFLALGYDLIYLPNIIGNLERDILEYFIPDSDLDLSPERLQNRFVGEYGVVLDSPAAMRQSYRGLSLIQSNEGDESSEEFLNQLLEYLEGQYPMMMAKESILCESCEASYGSLAAPASSPEISEEEYNTDQLIEELQALKESRLRELGLSESALRFLLRKQNTQYSRLVISRHAKIFLPDYGNKEIKLDDKTKALYFLFLRHTEGLSNKDLPQHTEELLDLYQSISGRDDPAAMRKTIENLCDPFQNNANISLSRIKKAFCEAFTPLLAKQYYVDGERGGLRSIALDRSLVNWETIR